VGEGEFLNAGCESEFARGASLFPWFWLPRLLAPWPSPKVLSSDPPPCGETQFHDVFTYVWEAKGGGVHPLHAREAQ
jgi:hypothetical protein